MVELLLHKALPTFCTKDGLKLMLSGYKRKSSRIQHKETEVN